MTTFNNVVAKIVQGIKPETYGLAWFNLKFSHDVLFYPSDFEQEVGTLREIIINNSLEV